MKKYEITENQVRQFNRMLAALRKISKQYMTPSQIRKDTKEGLEFEEYIEMAYENIQEEAKFASKGIKSLEIKQDPHPLETVL